MVSVANRFLIHDLYESLIANSVNKVVTYKFSLFNKLFLLMSFLYLNIVVYYSTVKLDVGITLTLFVGMFFVHRLITYIPTYSSVCYESFNLVSIVLSFMVIVLSLQTKLGEKVNVLLERIVEVVEGKVNIKEGQQNQQADGVSVSQPISQSGYIDNVNYQAGNPAMSGTVAAMTNQGTQQQTNFNKMYAGPNNPLQGAAQPQAQVQESFGGYQAANEVCAGFGGSSLF